MRRRIVGTDLGITGAHHAAVIDETCRVVARSRARPTADSLEALERLALEGAPEGTELEAVIDPTGAAWLPAAVSSAARGHRVFRPDVSQAAHLRRALARRKKTDRTCAEHLAKLAVWNREALHELEIPTGEAAELDRLVRATERLTEEIARRRARIRDLARTAMPLVGRAVSKAMGRADLGVLRSCGDPRELPGLGLETGETDREGQPMTKAGDRELRRMFIRAADTARKLDPQLARIHHVQMVERGTHHNKALCVVAAHLARRSWATMARGTPYVARDVDGRAVDRAEAKAIIAARYTVPEEVRARRRGRKEQRTAPHQVPVGHVFDAGPRRPARPRRPSPHPRSCDVGRRWSKEVPEFPLTGG